MLSSGQSGTWVTLPKVETSGWLQILLSDGGRKGASRSSHGAGELCGFQGMVVGVSTDT